MKYSLYELHSLEELKESKHFWMQKVAEASYDQVLLDDNSNPSPFQKAVIRTDLNRQLSERIGKISGNVDLLTYIIMMSAFQMQVYRLIHKNFFINIPAYEESNEESTEPADNLYLPYKTLLNDEMSVKEIIGNCKKELIEVYKHQFYPMQHVFAEAGMEETDRPLGQFSFSMKGLHQPQDIQQLMEAYKDQIHICIERSEQTISLEVTYNSNRFGKHTINSFLNCYVQVLEHAMSNVNAAISDIDLVTAEETVQILDHFNDTKQDYPAIRTMKEIFEEEAAFAQENIAVVSNGVELGYRELNERANQLARVLRAKGITRDSIVAILCDKSVETIIAMVAVIKAGGAYLPIDEEYPEARIRYLLEDSGSRILIGKENQAKRLNLEETGVMFIDVAGREASQESKKNLSEINQPTDLAYVIYTSGTTGKPKGVCVEQKSLIKIVKNAGYIDIKEGDKLLQSGSLSFDASVQQIWLALLNGIPLHMEKKELMLDLERIEEYIHKHQITHIIFPTTLFNQICQERIETFQNIRYVIAGGDVISSKQVSRLVKKYKDITVVNGYGPTENTVISTAYMIAGEWDEDKSVPIGKPVSNSTAYIMDKHHKLLPVGVPGELCVGGDGVARGYLNRPELAEEKFVLNPYVPGERIYKTGDLARWLPDGNLEFLGRMDQQVKIRGYRIELGEIEKQLTKHPQVKEAVVIDRKDESGASYLCGYLVGDGELSVAEVKEHLHRELPDYMVPAYLITLEKLPLTPNGKIDKKALPEPDVSQSEREIVAPRNDVERAIASVWCEVLGLKQVGIEQSFFDIGGDSIKSIQIVSRLRRHGVKLEVKDIMQYKTIAEIARHIKQTETVASQDVVEGPVVLTPIIRQFAEAVDKQVFSHFNQSMMLYAKEGFEEQHVRAVLEKLVIHHDALRMRLSYDGGVSGFNMGVDTELFECKVLSLSCEQEIEQEANELQASMDVEAGPLVKAGLFKTNEGDHLLLIMHHLVVDGVSWRILLEDFMYGYQAAREGKPIELPDKTTSFQEWAKKQYEYVNSSKMEKEEAYWRKLVEEPLDQIPRDGEPTKAVWKDMTTRTITLSQEATTKLLKETNRAYNTEINDILLSALGLAVKEWCGAEKIAIALEGHGREEIVDGVDTTRTVGWFTSCYPVILNMKDREIGMVIKRTKEYLRKVPNKGIGYGMLTQLTDRNSADLKIKADISFNYLGQFDQDMTDERITYSHLSTGNNASPDLPAWNSIQINSMIKHNQLCIMVDFHEKEFKEQTMDHFMAIYEEMLQKTIQHCAGKQETEQTPSDYGVNDYTLEDLEEIKAYVSEHIGENAVAAKINKLTPMQEGMLFTYLQEKDTTAYVLQSEFKVKGNIQLQLLNQAYQALCEKHLILNTIILDHWKHPAQIVIANREAAVEYEDFSQEADQEEAYQRYSKQIVTKGFELSRDRLFKLHLVRLKEEEYRLVVSCHHIIIDGWSNTFVRNDLFQLYEALANQEISPIRAEYDYEKYIQWLETQDRDEGLFYWKKHLEDYCEEIILPARKIEAPGYKEGLLEIELGNDMSNRLLQISKQCGVTLNTLCQTAWAILLQKYSNTSDVVFGAVVSGRPAAIAEVESMVGMFINTIPIRIKSEADQPIKELLAKAQAANNAAMPYEYLPLAEFQKLTALKQNLFQTLMVFENYPEQQASDRKPVFTAERIKGREQTSYDLNIVFMFEDKLSFALMYNQNVYEESFIGKFGKQLQYIFEKIAKQPEERIADIELVDQDEQHLILNRFNDTIRAYPRYKTINEIFEETAGRAGDKAAVVSSGVALGYRDLNERANQLARLLRKKGITRDSIASILCDKSVETIVAMLAVIKAGGAYLPIDKDYPEARIRYMLEDSRSTVLLGKQIWTTRLNLEGIRAELIDLDGEAASIESKENLELINQPEDLAYVIYTSGTTGNPKGVCITHRSVIKNAKNTNYIDVQEDDRFLQAGSLSFDAAVLPTWIALLIGIPLHMEDDEITMNFHSLEQYMLENRITLTVLPTTLFNQLSQERIEAFQNIRYVIAGGDIISSKQVSRLVKKYKDITVVNGYGPTENTVISTAYMIAGEWDEDKSVPIGKPVSNSTAYIMDKHHKLLPVGVPGELCVGGDGVARGYLNRPELTEEKFIVNPYVPQERIYKTGDLARWLPDGNLEFLGRIDQQVKIRGYRIELGEIEKQLTKHPLVNEAVVIDRKDESGASYLCGYLVGDGELSVAEVKEHLHRELPDYTVPAYLVTLEKLPLTPNGKIDKKALPEPDVSQSEREIVAPRNDVERAIASVWCEVLGLKQVGIEQSFFDIGGDSIKSIQIVSRLRRHGVKLEVKDIMQYKTIAEIARHIKQTETVASQDVVEGPVVLTPIIRQFAEAVDKQVFSHFNQSMMLYAKEGFEEQHVRAVLEKLVIHHDALRMRLSYDGGVSGFNMGVDTELFECKVLSLSCEQEIEQEANELQASMDVEAGPLVKAGLFKTNEGDHLLLIIHHLVVDGVSWRILLEDFMYGYQAAREGKPIELPDKTTSFQEWAKKQYEYVNSSKMEKEEAYWRKLVEEPLDQIPRDGEPTKAVWKDMTTRTITLSQEATTKLLKETNRAYNTEINDILLSALGLAVKEWCGAEKIAIALEGHGREEIVDGVDTTRTVGWFTSCYPVILEMRDREIGMVIKRTKENLRKVPNKGIGYGMLTQLTGNNSTDLKIQADISFNYLGQFDQDMTDERITYSHLSTGNNASPDLPSWNSIQINSMVKQNELCIMVDFHEKEFKEQTINRFMKIYEDMLQKTIQHCQARQETEQTPSDYGVNDYTLEDLEEIKAYVSEQIGENAVPGKINKLTPMQEGMLFTYLQEKDTTAYVLQTEFKLKGYVDAKRLNAVYNSLLRRYEVLRTVILNHWKHPSQIILDYREQQIEYQDFSQESNKEEQYKQAIDAKVEQGFDLSKDLLFTITLIKMSEDDYRLISTCHHIIIDGWSNSIILNEMFKAYRQMASGGLTEAPALNTYDSYIKWLFQQDEQQGLSFWSNYLQGYNKESIIPGNENSMPGYIEAEVTNKLSHELTQKLRTLCSENEVTFNTLCQAAWGMLLQKHTGNQDVVFGAVVSGRPPEIEGIDQMVGIFLNTIPVRVTVNNQTTIKQLLSDMQDKGNVAKSYEYLPLADIQNLSHRKQKLIETLMVFENYPIEELENNLNGEYESTFSVQEVSGREKTDYHLNIIFILRNELTYKILYNEQVYPAALIDRLSNQLAMIFEKVSACPEELVENVEIISQQEKEAITSFIEEYEQDLMAFGEGDFQFNMDED